MGLKPLVDGDILLYEIGFGAETGWQGMVNDAEAIPPFSYVEEMLHMRLNNIKAMVDTKEVPTLYITDDRTRTFRYNIAKTKPYKGTRTHSKPFHYRNLVVYMRDILGAAVAVGIEADDLMAIDHTASKGTTILCSRDKDLKQIPGWFYSWELGAQPSFGPTEITNEGTLTFSTRSNGNPHLSGTGLPWFYAQVLMGDTTDNIPGLPKCGPVKAYEVLNDPVNELFTQVQNEYLHVLGEDKFEERLLEQGQLCWIVRRLNGDGSPQIWQPGLES